MLCFPYSKVETAAIETELLRDYRFGQQQLIEIWGHACAIAITKVPPYSFSKNHLFWDHSSISSLIPQILMLIVLTVFQTHATF